LCYCFQRRNVEECVSWGRTACREARYPILEAYAGKLPPAVLGSAAELGRQTEGSNIMTDRSTPENIDEYIAAFSPEVQSILEKIRSTIRQAAPEAEEKIRCEPTAHR
jgi:hypothetical protein